MLAADATIKGYALQNAVLGMPEGIFLEKILGNGENSVTASATISQYYMDRALAASGNQLENDGVIIFKGADLALLCGLPFLYLALPFLRLGDLESPCTDFTKCSMELFYSCVICNLLYPEATPERQTQPEQSPVNDMWNQQESLPCINLFYTVAFDEFRFNLKVEGFGNESSKQNLDNLMHVWFKGLNSVDSKTAEEAVFIQEPLRSTERDAAPSVVDDDGSSVDDIAAVAINTKDKFVEGRASTTCAGGSIGGAVARTAAATPAVPMTRTAVPMTRTALAMTRTTVPRTVAAIPAVLMTRTTGLMTRTIAAMTRTTFKPKWNRGCSRRWQTCLIRNEE